MIKSVLFRPSTSLLVLSAEKRRGPWRFLGKTKTQYLDWWMRSNANICATIPWYFYRYHTIFKPARDAAAAKEQEDLLSEGKVTA